MVFEGIRTVFSLSHMCLACSPYVCDCLCPEIPMPPPDIEVTISGIALHPAIPHGAECMPFVCTRSEDGSYYGDPFDELEDSVVLTLRPVYSSPSHGDSFSPVTPATGDCDVTPRPFRVLGAPNSEDPLYVACDTSYQCSGFLGVWAYGEDYEDSPGVSGVRGALVPACTFLEEYVASPSCSPPYPNPTGWVAHELRLLVTLTCAGNPHQGGDLVLQYNLAGYRWGTCTSIAPPPTEPGGWVDFSVVSIDDCGYLGSDRHETCIRGTTLNDPTQSFRPTVKHSCQDHPLFTVWHINVPEQVEDCCSVAGGLSEPFCFQCTSGDAIGIIEPIGITDDPL